MKQATRRYFSAKAREPPQLVVVAGFDRVPASSEAASIALDRGRLCGMSHVHIHGQGFPCPHGVAEAYLSAIYGLAWACIEDPLHFSTNRARSFVAKPEVETKSTLSSYAVKAV